MSFYNHAKLNNCLAAYNTLAPNADWDALMLISGLQKGVLVVCLWGRMDSQSIGKILGYEDEWTAKALVKYSGTYGVPGMTVEHEWTERMSSDKLENAGTGGVPGMTLEHEWTARMWSNKLAAWVDSKDVKQQTGSMSGQ